MVERSIYIICTKECVDNKKQIYKIGICDESRASSFNREKGSLFLYWRPLESLIIDQIYSELIELSNRKFRNAKEYGSDYFECDIDTFIETTDNFIGNVTGVNYMMKSFKCVRCGGGFTNKFNLNKHLLDNNCDTYPFGYLYRDK